MHLEKTIKKSNNNIIILIYGKTGGINSMMDKIKKELIDNGDYNVSVTENGMVGYRTTGKALLDLNFSVSSLRNKTENDIVFLFINAYVENPLLAVKWLFYARDIREGLGERRLFRVCMRELHSLNNRAFTKNLHLISEYGRWDDLTSLIGIGDESDRLIFDIIRRQLDDDIENSVKDKPISLLAKWLPSENTSSSETRKLAKRVRKGLKLSSKDYRKTLSKLRKYLDVVEVKMCANKWRDIDYEKVPSMANLKYYNAFMRHDGLRRADYLQSVMKGEAKINSSVATPCDIVHEYHKGQFFVRHIKNLDYTLEMAWKNLKDIQVSDTLVVADGSGSMLCRVGKSGMTALDVATSLAIYTSEHNHGAFHNKYITFSNNPQYVEFTDDMSLHGKLKLALTHSEMTMTNIEKVFMLVLDTAVHNNLSQEDMPKNILIISDMEFNSVSHYNNNGDERLFNVLSEMYAKNGYRLPRLIFWNVNSRTGTIPVKENELGIALVSGFSPNILKMVMMDTLDPYELLVEVLNSPRYSGISVY